MRDSVHRAFNGQQYIADLSTAGTSWINSRPGGHQNKELIAAAVLVPLIDRASGMTVLLTERTAHLSAHAGQVSFPGGRQEAHDATPEHTALRETEEEIGVGRDRVELVGRLNARATGTGFHVVPVVGLIRPPIAPTPDPIEVATVFEVPLQFIMDPANHRFETRIQAGAERRFYAMTYDDQYIWGLTARLLVDLANRLRRR
jgi:8-oxo-dGTP pyrophosphatase MutT (NUDIX family)